MESLSLNEMELQTAGGDIITGFCVGIGAGSIVYGIGLSTQFWNPIGWVSAAFIVADAACWGYSAGLLE